MSAHCKKIAGRYARHAVLTDSLPLIPPSGNWRKGVSLRAVCGVSDSSATSDTSNARSSAICSSGGEGMRISSAYVFCPPRKSKKLILAIPPEELPNSTTAPFASTAAPPRDNRPRPVAPVISTHNGSPCRNLRHTVQPDRIGQYRDALRRQRRCARPSQIRSSNATIRA